MSTLVKVVIIVHVIAMTQLYQWISLFTCLCYNIRVYGQLSYYITILLYIYLWMMTLWLHEMYDNNS